MATTQYQLLCRYYNIDMKKPITNLSDKKWVSCFDVKPKDGDFVQETFRFLKEPNVKQERELQELLIEGNNSSNPKFNMFFMYKSRDFIYNEEGSSNFPYILMDRMERVILSPWFVHSTHSSLQSVMGKAKALANLIGHENVKIGKVVPLDQYVEIV